MVEWPCCYDPLRLSLGSYDLFFTNISPPLSLLARSLWVTEVDEPHNRRLLCWVTEVQCGKVCWATEVQCEKYSGSRKCSAKNMLGHGSAVRKICWGTEVQYGKYAGARKCSTKKSFWVTEDHCDSPPRRSCRAKSPPAFWRAVLFRAPV